MTPNEALALFHPDDLGDILGVAPRTVRRWQQGTAPIPDPIVAWLERMAQLCADAPKAPVYRGSDQHSKAAVTYKGREPWPT